MGKFASICRSARILLWLAIISNAAAAAHLCGLSISKAILIGLTLSSAASFGFLLNDLVDVVADQHNGRSVAKGATNSTKALRSGVALICVVASLTIAFRVHPYIGIAASLLNASLALYSLHTRNKLIWANILAAVSSVSPLWFPLIIGEWNTQLILIASASAVLAFGREVFFDYEDAAGDSAAGRKTIPIVWGRVMAMRTTLTSLLVGGSGVVWAAFLGRASEFAPLLAGTVSLFCLMLVFAGREVMLNREASVSDGYTLFTRAAMLTTPVIMVLLS